MIDPRVSQIASLVSGGDLFDTNLTTRLANLQPEITQLKATLDNAGIASNQLSSLNYGAISNLGSHVASVTPTLMDRMGTFSSISSIDGPQSVTTAFGPLLQARSLISALDSVKGMMNGNATEDREEIAARLTQINSIPANVNTTISNSTSFFASSESRLANLTIASDLCSMYGSYPLKAVLGAVGSDELINALNDV